MYAFLMILFIILCICLATVILFLQQGKGDLGVGSMAGSQMLFGGSGGQTFFEKATWIMGALFIAGALGLTIVKSRELRSSVLEGVTAPQKKAIPQAAAMQQESPLATASSENPMDDDSDLQTAANLPVEGSMPSASTEATSNNTKEA